MTDKDIDLLLKLVKVIESLSRFQEATMREIAALLGPGKPNRRTRAKAKPKVRRKTGSKRRVSKRQTRS